MLKRKHFLVSLAFESTDTERTVLLSVWPWQDWDLQLRKLVGADYTVKHFQPLDETADERTVLGAPPQRP